jgi:hypothetical protein
MLFLLEHRAQSQQTQMIHSKLHFALQQANSRSIVPVNLPMVEKTLKASPQIRRKRTLQTTAEVH